MYLWRLPLYLSTRCRLEYLIPILVRKVWKIFVNLSTAWSLSYCSVVHFLYRSLQPSAWYNSSLKSSLKNSQVTVTVNNEVSYVSFYSQQVSHQSLTQGTTLKSAKVIFSLSEKLWTEKYPYTIFNHLSTTFASISPSNNGI